MTRPVVRLRIDVAYDGGRFAGFARQPDQRTVQGVLEDALSRLCRAQVLTVGAGRTDRGVHATAQVLHADVSSDAACLDDLAAMRRALDRLAGADVTVWRVRRAAATFDARFSATRRRYRYRLCDAEALDPLERHRVWHVGPPRLDVSQMDAAGQHLVGEHDFSSFCRRSGDRHLIRRVDLIAVRRLRADLVMIAVEGPGFCHQMVRSITGCLVTVGLGRQEPQWVADVLAARDRQTAGRVAPPHGLTLTGVSYDARYPGVGRPSRG